MKNLYPEGGKGKIHPSPAPPSAVPGGGGSSPSGYGVLAVLKLLPAAIFALTVAMTYEDKEVLAYLITRSIHGGPATALAGGGGDRNGEDRPRCRRAAAGFGHRPGFDCGCFDCYTSFWSRWDCSPDRELIHQAIEAFEEHLACSEKSVSVRGRRRARKTGGESAEKGKKVKDKEKRKKKADGVTCVAEEQEAKAKALEDMLAVVVSTSGVESFAAEEKGGALEETTTAPASVTIESVGEDEAVPIVEEEEEEAPVVSGGDERRRGWPDVMGMFKSRLWSLWGPGV